MDSVHVFLSGSSNSRQGIADLKLENISLDELFLEAIKENVESELGYDKYYQKLVWNGKILQDDKTLGEYYRDHPISKPSRSAADELGARTMMVTLIASQKADVEKIQQLKEDKLMRGFDNTRSQYVAKPRATSDVRLAGVNANKYGFGGVHALPNFADSNKATALLEKLANDRGVLHVMSHYQWKVGVLKEMPPDGKVGVDPVCVLGYNTNKGQEIHLRLRTDDLKGFRPWYKLIEVLCHELSHNIHSEHDSNFYALMRDIMKEQKEVEEKYQTGYRLDHRDYYEGDDTGAIKQQFQGKSEKLGSGPSGSYAGGNSNDNGSSNGNSHTQLAEATTRRQLSIPSSMSAENPLVKQSIPEEAKAPMDIEVNALAESTQAVGLLSAKVTGDAADLSEPRNEIDTIQDEPKELPKIPTKNRSKQAKKLNSVSVPSPVEDSLAEALKSNQTLAALTDSSTQRMLRINHAIQDLCSEILTKSCNLVNVRDGVYKTFRQYIHNALFHPNDLKFRRIPTNNQVFQQRLGRYNFTSVALRAVGFELDEAKQEWVLKNYDPVLLRMALDVLH